MLKIISLVLFVLVAPLFAASEIVLTVPVETKVGVPGLRDTATVWVELIQNAKTSIHLEHFYLSDEPDEALTPVLKALREASGRGVKTQLLLDKKFFQTYPEPATSLAKLPGFSFNIIDFDKLTGGVQHAKFMIVDGQRFYVGSANFDWRALKHIHEVGVAGDDEAVAQHLEEVFAMDWSSTKSKGIRSESDTFKVVGSPEGLLPKGVDYSLTEILALLNGAKEEVQLTVYELSEKIFGQSHGEWTVLYDAIKAAGHRGVKVSILIDGSKVKPDAAALKKLADKNITIKGVHFPAYSGGEIPFARLLHSKFLIVDGKTAWVGTDNWAKSYFTNSRGVGVVFSDASLLKSLRAVFSVLWKSEYATAI